MFRKDDNMNNKRRKALMEINSKLENIKSELESCLCEEQNYFDNMPENLQSSVRAMDSEEAIDNMEIANDNLDEIINLLNETIENIDNATI